MLFPNKTTYYLLQCLKQNLIILPLSLFYNGTVTFLGFHPSGIFPSSRNTLYTLVCHSATASPCLSFSCSSSTTGVLPFFNLLITFLTPLNICFHNHFQIFIDFKDAPLLSSTIKNSSGYLFRCVAKCTSKVRNLEDHGTTAMELPKMWQLQGKSFLPDSKPPYKHRPSE